MQKYILLTLLILSTQSRTRFSMDRFTGCTTNLFPNPRNFRVLQIEFSTACAAFETCAASYNTNQETCIDNFEIAQIAFCDQYTSVNLWRRRYCKRIVAANMVLARKLSDDKFKNHEEAFVAQINDEGATANCLEGDLATAVVCVNGTANQLFTFFRLGNDKYVIKNNDGKCVNGSLSAVDCNFDDEEQWMTIDASGVASASITNKDDATLDLSTAATPAFNAASTAIGLNVVA